MSVYPRSAAERSSGAMPRRPAGPMGVILRVGAVVALILGSFLASAPANAAPSCSGSSCNGHDPQAYGCGSDAITLEDRADDTYLYVELRYSKKCDAAWARVTYIQGEQLAGATSTIVGLRWYSCNKADSSCFKGQYTSGAVTKHGQTKYTVMRQYHGDWLRACAYADPTQCTQQR